MPIYANASDSISSIVSGNDKDFNNLMSVYLDAVFAVKVNKAEITSATRIVKREERSKSTFKRFPSSKTEKNKPATSVQDALKKQPVLNRIS